MSSYASLYELSISIVCGYCNAEPGEQCVTSSGATASYRHAARTGAVYQAYGVGYCEGNADGIEAAIDLLKRYGGSSPWLIGELTKAAEGWRK